jgi:hypothetical protein
MARHPAQGFMRQWGNGRDSNKRIARVQQTRDVSTTRPAHTHLLPHGGQGQVLYDLPRGRRLAKCQEVYRTQRLQVHAKGVRDAGIVHTHTQRHIVT